MLTNSISSVKHGHCFFVSFIFNVLAVFRVTNDFARFAENHHSIVKYALVVKKNMEVRKPGCLNDNPHVFKGM